ncbi:MAG TPA: hypothetical protein VFA71_13520 [Terriglobales bacterium]|nr:hypothetical protein [Terriglobales bacterium]
MEMFNALSKPVGKMPTGQPAGRRRYLRAVAVLLLLSLASLSGAATRNVTISNFAFTDAVSNNSTTVINAGETVQWSWSSGTHSTTSGTCSPGCTPSGTWDSTILSAPSGTFSFTFNNDGSFPYYCRVHLASMTGKVIVNPVVTNTNDSGAGSLRQAILDLNADPDLTTITFNIPGGGVHTIIPLSPLPVMSHPGVLDGTSQPGWVANAPVIELDGASAGASAVGLSIQAGNTTVRGLVINRFAQGGIVLQSNGNTITGNFIGTNSAGNTSLANGGVGILIPSGESNNTIGGTTAAARNVISGNSLYGIQIAGLGTNANIVEGNFIGTDVSGSVAVGNGLDGVRIQSGAANNIIGGISAGTGNLISGNHGNGIGITLGGTTGNIVLGNLIGTNAAGTVGLANSLNGILINNNASNNTIGGQLASAANIISGNSMAGIAISDSGTSSNGVQGNFIGTDPSGAAAVPNVTGVLLENGATTNLIGGSTAAARNVISGNAGTGVQITSPGTNGNSVAANFIGINAAGTAALGNAGNGILVNSGATNNTIGGGSAGSGNVISGNISNGILISGTGTNGNTVLGNFIGVDFTANFAIGNGGYGVFVISGAGNNVIGMAPGTGNVISGNGLDGIGFSGSGTTGNAVTGNLIGTNLAGTAAIANSGNGVSVSSSATNNIIGGTSAGVRNIISGNSQNGILIFGGGSNGNAVQGNFIGTDTTGAAPVGNGLDGVRVDTGITTIIGGTAPGAGNVIAFNAKGVVVVNNGATGNTIEGNSIFSNTGLGIDLKDDGVTPNNSNGHVGPNNLQNYPVLTAAAFDGSSSTLIHGTFNSNPNTTFRLEFFSNAACDPSLHGQGKTSLGSQSVTTDSGGNATLNASFSTSNTSAQSISATATDPAGNTSEFSACQPVDYPLANVVGRNLHVRLGKAVPLVVASFMDTDPSGSAGQFSASIDWGDGTAPSAGTVVSTGVGQNYNVIGTHAYIKVGAWTVTVTINDSGGASATVTSKARLWPKPLSY